MYRVMIVDDEIASQNIIKKYISDTMPMYKVTSVVGTGQEALDSFFISPVDIVLVDIHMPVMDGLTFIEHLLKTTNEVVFIIISGYSEFSYAQTAMRLGVIHYLLKPIDFKELRHALEAATATLRFKRIAQTSLQTQEDEHELYLRSLLMGRYKTEKEALDLFQKLSFPFSYHNDEGLYIRVDFTDIKNWFYENDSLLTAVNNMISLLYKPKYILCVSRRMNGYDYFIVVDDDPIPNLDKFQGQTQELLHIKLSAFLMHRFSSLEELRSFIERGSSATTEMTSYLSPDDIDEKDNNLFPSIFNIDNSTKISIDNAIQFMNDHYAEDLTRDMVAHAVYMSGAHFSRCFKLVTNVSYKDYLTEIRMNKAIELLKTDIKISDIAQQVGYNNPNRFNINFRQYTSYTPSDYRTFVLKIL